MIIELDHSSSGAQIAACLTRNQQTAHATNITEDPVKQDLYTAVLTDANDALEELGFFKDDPTRKPLERSEVKTPVIAMIYGGSVQRNAGNVFKQLYRIDYKGNEKYFKAFYSAITEHMGAVMAVQEYVRYIVDTVNAAGGSSVTLSIGNGGKFTQPLAFKEKAFKHRVHFNKTIEGERKMREIVSARYLVDENALGAAARTLTAAVVQSLDATILSMTQAKLEQEGIEFYSKHDAYLIDEDHSQFLVEASARTMYDVFKVDLMQQMYLETQRRYGDLFEAAGVTLEPFTKYGEYNILSILKSQYLITE